MPKRMGPAAWLEPEDELYREPLNSPKLRQWAEQQGLDTRWPLQEEFDKEKWRWISLKGAVAEGVE